MLHTRLNFRNWFFSQKFLNDSLSPSVVILVVALILGSLQACSTPLSYKEHHTVQNLKVVFLDEKSLHQEWAKRTGKGGIRFTAKVSASTGTPVVKTVKGFYDYSTGTIYCPKWNFEVCGHELHHAVIGQFHSQE